MSVVNLPAQEWERNQKESMFDSIAARPSLRDRYTERDTAAALRYWLDRITCLQRQQRHVPVWMLDRIDELRVRYAVLKEGR